MTSAKFIYKVPEGKLLKIFLEFDEDRINSVKITGDFFVYPEESIETLEKELKNALLEKTVLEKKISEFVLYSKTEFFGITISGLADAILGAAGAK